MRPSNYAPPQPQNFWQPRSEQEELATYFYRMLLRGRGLGLAQIVYALFSGLSFWAIWYWPIILIFLAFLSGMMAVRHFDPRDYRYTTTFDMDTPRATDVIHLFQIFLGIGGLIQAFLSIVLVVFESDGTKQIFQVLGILAGVMLIPLSFWMRMTTYQILAFFQNQVPAYAGNEPIMEMRGTNSMRRSPQRYVSQEPVYVNDPYAMTAPAEPPVVPEYLQRRYDQYNHYFDGVATDPSPNDQYRTMYDDEAAVHSRRSVSFEPHLAAARSGVVRPSDLEDDAFERTPRPPIRPTTPPASYSSTRRYPSNVVDGFASNSNMALPSSSIRRSPSTGASRTPGRRTPPTSVSFGDGRPTTSFPRSSSMYPERQ